jgi:hypothetical protein
MLPSLRAQRHPDADLVRALRDEVRHRAIDADRRQQQGDRAKISSRRA